MTNNQVDIKKEYKAQIAKATTQDQLISIGLRLARDPRISIPLQRELVSLINAELEKIT